MTIRPAHARNLVILVSAAAALCACATPHPRLAIHLPKTPAAAPYKVGEPYQVAGVWYVPREQPNYDEVGVASWYGAGLDQKPTASGEVFDGRAVTGAHTTLPLPSMVEVTNLDNGRRAYVRLNDRGPFVGGRIIDLSPQGARELGFEQQGSARVRVRYVGPAAPPDLGARYAANLRTPGMSGPTPTVSAPHWDAPSVRASDLAPAAPRFAAAPPAAAAPVPAMRTASLQAPVQAAPVQTAPLQAAPLQAAPTSLYRIQAGAFGDPANAQRVQDQLAGIGRAVIEPTSVNGATFYRVMLMGPPDEAGALALRQRVVQLGFADARMVRPY